MKGFVNSIRLAKIPNPYSKVQLKNKVLELQVINKDHLGNIRLTYADSDGNGSINPATEIIEESNYYPGGMAMPGRKTVGGELYRYGYQGEYAETDPETGKPMFQLRLYDPRINRWLSPDPMGQYHSPYMAMDNRPNMSVDPTGGSTDWHYDEKGNLVTDDGDTAQGLADFKGISLSEAQNIISAEGFLTDFNSGLGLGLAGDQVAYNRGFGSPYKLGNFEFENSGVSFNFTSYFLGAFQHLNRYSGPETHAASIQITGNVSINENNQHVLTVDGYASKSNHPSVSAAQSYINIKYRWDESQSLASKSVGFGRNPRTFIYSSDKVYLGHGTLILPLNSNDIKRLTITAGVNARTPSMIGLKNVVSVNENMMNLITY